MNLTCEDGIACTIDSCAEPDLGCEHRPENPTTFCDDQVACTVDDYAASCDCTHTPSDSACDDDGDPCTAGACNPATGCASICDDGNACTTDLCDSGTGECSHVELNCSN